MIACAFKPILGDIDQIGGCPPAKAEAGGRRSFQCTMSFAVLDRIPKNSPIILTSSTKRPWVKDGLGSSFAKAKRVAWPKGDDLHFHDQRGTAACQSVKLQRFWREKKTSLPRLFVPS